MEETFLHAKSFDNGFPVLTQYWIHLFEDIIRIVHLVEHQIEWRIGIVKSSREDNITIAIDQTIKGTNLTRSDEFLKEILRMSIPFCLEMIYIFWCFKFKGRRCSYSIVRFGNQWQPNLLHGLINVFFCFNHSTRNDWDSSLLEEFLHFGFELGFLQIFWLSPEDIELLPKRRIQFQPVLIMRLNAIDWAMFIKEKGYRTLHFVQIFQIFNTEIFC